MFRMGCVTHNMLFGNYSLSAASGWLAGARYWAMKREEPAVLFRHADTRATHFLGEILHLR